MLLGCYSYCHCYDYHCYCDYYYCDYYYYWYYYYSRRRTSCLTRRCSTWSGLGLGG